MKALLTRLNQKEYHTGWSILLGGLMLGLSSFQASSNQRSE
jgi:hypothetical protein